MGQTGFTLVELMIALFIMGSLMVLVSTSVRSSVKNKQKLSNRIAGQARLFDAIRLMKTDVSKAFHYQDFFYEIEKRAINNLKAAQNTSGKQGQSSQGRAVQPYRVPRRPRKLTHFLGETESVHFTSLNNFRTRYNSPESDQMEVGYFVDSCNAKKDRAPTRCLFRRTSPLLDDKVDEGGRKRVLLEHITEFKLEYKSNQENEEWNEQWRSDDRGRADHRNKFPHMLRMTIGTHDEGNKYAAKLKETIVMNVHFPNNQSMFPPEKANARSQNR